MTQLEMNYRDGGAGYKAAGPSQEAAEEMNKRAAYLRAKCLSVLRSCDEWGLTADQVASALKASVLSIRPRITELHKAKPTPLIVDTGIRRKNASGRNATVWRIA